MPNHTSFLEISTLLIFPIFYYEYQMDEHQKKIAQTPTELKKLEKELTGIINHHLPILN